MTHPAIGARIGQSEVVGAPGTVGPAFARAASFGGPTGAQAGSWLWLANR